MLGIWEVGCVRFVSMRMVISLYVLVPLHAGSWLTLCQAASFNVSYAHKWRDYVCQSTQTNLDRADYLGNLLCLCDFQFLRGHGAFLALPSRHPGYKALVCSSEDEKEC